MVKSVQGPQSGADYIDLFKQTYQEWSDDKAARLGAALAYYTIFSLSPLLVVAISVAGLFLGEQAARGQLASQIHTVVGPQAAQFIESLMQSTSKPSASILATIIGLLTLLLGAMGVFTQMQDSMNTIWEIEPRKDRTFVQSLKDRFTPFVVLLGSAFLILVSLVANTAVAFLGEWMASYLPLPAWIMQTGSLLITLGVGTVLFALIFRVLPDAEIAWHDVWIGAFLTGILFVGGQLGLAWYAGKAAEGSTYGAAGSLVAVLVWVYWSAQILFFGAEFTQVYANKYGSRLLPANGATFSAEVTKAPMALPTRSASTSSRQSSRAKKTARPLTRAELIEDWGAILAGMGLAFILHRLFRRK